MRRDIATFVGVSLVYGFGSTAMSLTAAIWVKSLTGSSGLAALAGLFVYAPTLAGPALGALVDRLPIRPTLVVTSLTMAALLLTLLTVDSADQLWLLYAVMLAYGVNHLLIDAADNRLVAATLPPDALGTTNGLRLSAQEATKLVAPLVGAGLFAWIGGGAVATLSAIALAASAALYFLVRPRNAPAPPTPRDPLWTQIAAGLRHLRHDRRIRTPVLLAALAMGVSGLGTAAIYAVVDALHRPPAFVGVLSSVQGAGAIVGGLAAGRLLTRLGECGFATLGAAVFALGPLAQATGWLPAILAGSLLIGIGLPWPIVAALTAVQRLTPPALLGRVSASATTAIFAPPALGIPLGALLVSTVDYRWPLIAAAAITFTAVLLLIRAVISL